MHHPRAFASPPPFGGNIQRLWRKSNGDTSFVGIFCGPRPRTSLHRNIHGSSSIPAHLSQSIPDFVVYYRWFSFWLLTVFNLSSIGLRRLITRIPRLASVNTTVERGLKSIVSTKSNGHNKKPSIFLHVQILSPKRFQNPENLVGGSERVSGELCPGGWVGVGWGPLHLSELGIIQIRQNLIQNKMLLTFIEAATIV